MAHYGDGDCIAAAATAQGVSALAIVRVSGEASLERLARVFSKPARMACAKGNSVVHGWITEPEYGAKIDEVLVSVYRAPATCTGENGADIVCHGGSVSVRTILSLLFRNGFREALGGEFTFRSFMNGKLDLTRAESVMEIVCSKTERTRRGALTRLEGSLETEIRTLKNTLTEALAACEILLDYSEVDGVTMSPEDERAGGVLPEKAKIVDTLAALENLAAAYNAQKIFREGALVVIAGAPNAGKSSLFNMLLKEERAIVTPTAGTTRDWLESEISINGIPVRLADTAGLRDESEKGLIEEIEQIGIDKSRRLIETADLVLYMVGADEARRSEIETAVNSGGKTIAVWNKADLNGRPPVNGFVPVSSKTGAGIAALLNIIEEKLLENAKAAGAVEAGMSVSPGTERQKTLIDGAISACKEALQMEADGCTLDLIAPALRDAVDCLGEITGEVSTADLLEKMFGTFCVGK